jgi:hypothetical protein
MLLHYTPKLREGLHRELKSSSPVAGACRRVTIPAMLETVQQQARARQESRNREIRLNKFMRIAEGRESDTHSQGPVFKKVGLEPNRFEIVFFFATSRRHLKAM